MVLRRRAIREITRSVIASRSPLAGLA